MSDITTQTIDRIIELAPAEILEIGGYTHIDKDKAVKMFAPPVPEPITISTLTGFVALLEADFESFAADGVMVHVAAHDQVRFTALASDRYGRRQSYIEARALKAEREFTFGRYIPQEEFVIALRSLFVADDGLTELVEVAGNLAKNAEVRQTDDGFTQSVTAKTGVVRLAEREINPRRTLTPFRTFREVVQPSSEYLFRVKGGEAGTMCALFEADGGTWKLEAIQTVKAWLANNLKGSAVDGLGDIPIIA